MWEHKQQAVQDIADDKWLSMAIEMLATDDLPGAPFSGLIVRSGQVIGKGSNTVRSDRDPRAHAEVQAIRDAAMHVRPNLTGSTLYAASEPCPMCLSAPVYAGVRRIVFSLSAEEAAEFGFNYGTSSV